LGPLKMPLYALAMSSEYSHPLLTFEEWKFRLGEDCHRTHKLLIVENSGDHKTPSDEALAVLWIRGIEPTVQAIIDEGDGVDRTPTDA